MSSGGCTNFARMGKVFAFHQDSSQMRSVNMRTVVPKRFPYFSVKDWMAQCMSQGHWEVVKVTSIRRLPVVELELRQLPVGTACYFR
jgi:hypothetical protein